MTNTRSGRRAQEVGEEFEEHVRRVADALFELSPGQCKPKMYKHRRRTAEIDGVAVTRDVTHLIMATTERSLKKVESDCEKLTFAASSEEHNGTTVKRWMIVRNPPQAPHSDRAKKSGVTLLTLQQFQDRFFDGQRYVAKRENAPFGSARDLESGSPVMGRDEYVQPPFSFVEKGEETSLADLVDRVSNGQVVVLQGPFGSGKSLSIREIWFALRSAYLKSPGNPVPLALNLRDHWGQTYPDEILRRHARSIGFESEADIVSAWRAGNVTLLVDGFDEVASQGITLEGDRDVLRQARRDALQGTRSLLRESVERTGILIAGRDHYFDDLAELRSALGIDHSPSEIVAIGEFDEPRAKKYLGRRGFRTELPSWLPRRALLLGYLASRDLLPEVLAIDALGGQALAWSQFVELLSRREADLPRVVMDHEAVRQVLQHLAVQLRASASGVGPITEQMLGAAYEGVTGQRAGGAVLMQLQRLPGLTERDAQPGSRSFVDGELLATLQGSAVADMVPKSTRPSGVPDSRAWMAPLDPLGCEVAALRLRQSGRRLPVLVDRIRSFYEAQLGGDLLHVAIAWAISDQKPLECRGQELRGVHLGELDLDEVVIRDLVIRDCIVDRLVVGSLAPDSSISASGTHFGEISGVGSRAGLPSNISLDSACGVDHFESLATTASIVALDIDPRTKAFLTALKKLYRQRGAGRVIGAFRRGVPDDVRGHVDAVLDILVREGFAHRQKDVYHPIRKNTGRAHRILDNPRASQDPIMSEVLQV